MAKERALELLGELNDVAEDLENVQIKIGDIVKRLDRIESDGTDEVDAIEEASS
jgi:hypothetical protein